MAITLHAKGNLFDSPASVKVITVNLVGAMGAGVAKVVRDNHPDVYRTYRKLCWNQKLDIGKLALVDQFLLFPTKTDWRLDSKLNYIEEGLITLVKTHQDLGLEWIAMPPLGCGNGNLSWSVVKPLIYDYLNPLTTLDVELYAPVYYKK